MLKNIIYDILCIDKKIEIERKSKETEFTQLNLQGQFV